MRTLATMFDINADYIQKVSTNIQHSVAQVGFGKVSDLFASPLRSDDGWAKKLFRLKSFDWKSFDYDCQSEIKNRNRQFRQNLSRGSLDHEVNKHGRAGWQGNEFSSKEAFRGTLEREVKTKQKTLPPSLVDLLKLDTYRITITYMPNLTYAIVCSLSRLGL